MLVVLLHLLLASLSLLLLLAVAPTWWFRRWSDVTSRWRLRPIGHATLLATDADHAPIMTIIMVVQGVWLLESLAGLMCQRMAADPTFFRRFCSRVAVDTNDFELVPGFNPASHIHDVPLEHRHKTPLEFAELMATQVLTLDQPLWACHVLPVRDNRTFVVWRIHHALADGASVHAFFARLSDNPPVAVVPPAASHTVPSKWKTLGQHAHLVIKSLWLYGKKATRVLLQPEPRTRLNQAGGRAKRMFYTTGYSVKTTKAMAKHLGVHVTVNDVFLSCITGALRAMLMEEASTDRDAMPSGLTDPTCVVRAGISVDLRQPGDVPTMAEPDNRFSCLLVALPLGEACPVRRLHLIVQAMDEAKNSLERYITFALSTMVAQFPPRVLAKVVAFLTSHSSVAISNVRGPRHVLYFDGHPLESLHGYVPPPPCVNMGIAIYSMADALGVSVQVNASVFQHPDKFLVHVQREYDELQRCAAKYTPTQIRRSECAGPTEEAEGGWGFHVASIS
ncbi:hypothetical protein H310_01797 [Aphanomyces invadans]|uniref:Uncharacterized protein n=1 Tax=Aphanomyces invadans TaxID=157072 RepID=A0A024UNJ3_9STRA|nr:hypothetical protein H310_01797 [Aphanomyces invadans]ETW07208.1 hypothetical protein H310_01797 [Aphanomyces invadans]|eukprot:XP_008863301.1 hypothetical protein H310_01797 [Aphanomyces invadans]